MQNGLFRKESLDHISSPEQMHDYLRVTTPRLWMILTAILVLLAGLLVYASTATMESTITVQAQVFAPTEEDRAEAPEGAGNSAYFYITLPLEQKDTLQVGMTVRIAGTECRISTVAQDEESVFATGVFEDSQIPIQSGQYDAVVVTESTTPISFLLN